MSGDAVATIIPTYGGAPYLPATLASLERQTFRPDEVVVVDDGSCPPVKLQKYDLPLRVERIRHSGISAARNEGIRRSGTPLVHICDHDDLLEPEFYQRMVSTFASRPSSDVVHSACGFIDAEGGMRTGLLPGSPPDYAAPGNTLRTLLRVNPIASVATIFRRQLADDLRGFRGFDFVQDWDFWLRAAAEGAEFAFVGEVLAWHRVHAAQQSAPERTPLVLGEARRMLRSQKLPRRQWLTREQKIADLHLEEAAHRVAMHEKRGGTLANLLLAAPARPRACLRTLVRLWP